MGVIKNINYAAFQNCIIDEFEIKKEVDVKRVLFIEDDFLTGTLNGVFCDTYLEPSVIEYTFKSLSAYIFGQLQNKKFYNPNSQTKLSDYNFGRLETYSFAEIENKDFN